MRYIFEKGQYPNQIEIDDQELADDTIARQYAISIGADYVWDVPDNRNPSSISLLRHGRIDRAYTIGNFHSYDKVLSTGEVVRKIGKEENYSGGCIWRTKEEAQAFIDADKIMIDGTKRDNKKFAVYQLELVGNWDSDVSKDPDKDGVYVLLVDAVIVGKV